MPTQLPLQTDVALDLLNTFGIAATARHFLHLTAIDQLQLLSELPMLASLPRLILGGGSNVILTRDFPGLVLHMGLRGRELVDEDEHDFYVRAAGGENWHEFVSWTLQQGWGGLENLSLIPGSVGAAPIQNIGAYGVELKDRFHSLHWFEFATGKVHSLTLADCQFAYRDSVFKHGLRDLGVILDVTFALPKHWQPQLGYGDVAQSLASVTQPTAQQISTTICAIRQSKLPDPHIIGNAGSFFKNPLVSAEQRQALLARYPALISYSQPDGRYKLAAGWLIEQAGWKGRALGNAGVYARQALVLVNLGGVTGAAVLALAQSIQADVMQQFGVQLETEPVFV